MKKTAKEKQKSNPELAEEKMQEYITKAKWQKDRFTIYVRSYNPPRFYRATNKNGTLVVDGDSLISDKEREEYIYNGAKVLLAIRPKYSANKKAGTKSVKFVVEYGVFVTHGKEIQPREVEEELVMERESLNSALADIDVDILETDTDLSDIELPED